MNFTLNILEDTSALCRYDCMDLFKTAGILNTNPKPRHVANTPSDRNAVCVSCLLIFPKFNLIHLVFLATPAAFSRQKYVFQFSKYWMENHSGWITHVTPSTGQHFNLSSHSFMTTYLQENADVSITKIQSCWHGCRVLPARSLMLLYSSNSARFHNKCV